MKTRLATIVVFAIAVQVSALTASADPVQVVSGRLSFDTGGPPFFSLLTSSGQRFEGEGFAQGWSAPCFYQCSLDVPIPMSSVSTGLDGMVFLADGKDVYAAMRLVLSAPTITPSSDSGTVDGPFVDYERPFTMSGRLAGYASPDFAGVPLFDLSLSGSGIASLGLVVEEGRYSFSSLDYVFEGTPVPEPGTLLLAGAGAAFLWRRRVVARAAEGRRKRAPIQTLGR